MTKQIWRKITDGGILNAKDLTVEQKKMLYAVMEGYGLPKATCYSRFFDKGFDKWEIKGVSKIKEDFLVSELRNSDDRKLGKDCKFYNLVTNMKIGVRLCEVMSSLGMTSQMTVRTRFKANDWKPWEEKGIAAILNEDLSF